MSIEHFIVLGLATWRCASLLANEQGPYGVFAILRHALGVRYVYNEITRSNEFVGSNVIAKGILCVWCNSIWLAALWVIYYYTLPWTFYIALVCALSTVAIVIDTIVGEQS